MVLVNCYSHKDAIRDGRCVVPLRKECQKSECKFATTQMSSQQVVNNNKASLLVMVR